MIPGPDLCKGVEKENFIHIFFTFYPNVSPLEVGFMTFKISHLLTYRCYIPNLVKIGPVDFEKMLTKTDNA